MVSSFQSWDELGRWYGGLQTERIKPSPEVQAKAAELTRGAADDDAKLRAIYKYVSTEFRYIGIAFGVGRYQPHYAAEVLANQYGDCKDKHTLLASLLNAAGIKAYPALISSSRDIDAEMPSPSQINHVITVIPRGNTMVWLDSTTEVGPFQYLIAPLRNKYALVIWGDRAAELINTPEDLPFPATQNFRMDAKLSDDGTLQGDAELSTRGDAEYMFRQAFRSVPMSQWKELAQRISLNLGFGGEVSDVSASSPEKTDEPFHFSYKYTRKEFGDWPNRRILAAAPAIGLPLLTDEAAASSVPLWLGPPLEMVFHTQIEIPKGYSLEAPASIHLKRDFAEYDSTYSFKEGRLISDRHLHTITTELPKTASDEYKKFCKKIQDDYQAFIQLSSIRNRAPDEQTRISSAMINAVDRVADSMDPEALRLEGEANQAFRRYDFQSAISSLYRAVAADPKFTRAWIRLGSVLIFTQQTDSGIDAFKKAIALDPKEPATYQVFAMSLMETGKPKEAVPAWQDYLKLNSEDADGYFYLGKAFQQLQRYDDAATALESAVKLNSGQVSYQLQLAVAYLRADNGEKAKVAFRRLLELQPGPEMLNQAAWDIEKSHELLPVALKFAEKAVRAEEEESTKIDGANLQAEDAWKMHNLAAYWSTLGWLQGRSKKLDEAEKTLKAAWQLTQNNVAAARLCELYEGQRKKQAAISMCRFAAYRLPLEEGQALEQIGPLNTENNKRLEELGGGSAPSTNMVPISDEIFRMRNFKLPHLVPGTETGEIQMLLAYDSKTGKFHVENVKYVKGSEKLKTLDKTLRALNFSFTSPDGNPVQVVIHGTLSCYPLSGWQFVLLDAPSGRLVKLKLQKQE